MARLGFSTDISDLGLFRRFAKTRRTLVVTVIIFTLLAWAIGFASAWYALNVSTSVVLNLLAITANMMVVLVTAALQAILVGDLTFSGPWREQVILGVQGDRVSVKNHGAEFLIITVLAIVANVIGLELSTGGFFEKYHHEGFFEVRLRAEDPAERQAALVHLRDPMSFQLWERPGIQALVLRHIDDPDTTVQSEAIFCAGLLKLQGSESALIKEATTSSSGVVRGDAAVALGKLGSSPETIEVLQDLADSNDSEAREGAFRGLALLASPLTLPFIHSKLSSEDFHIRVLAYWVARQIEDDSSHDILKTRLDQKLELNEKCAVLDALKMVATKEDVVWARLQFSNSPHNLRCDPLIWEERDEKQHYVTYSDSLRVKYLKIVANADAKGQKEWFARVLSDNDEEEYAREVAQAIIKNLEGRR
jgi:hypothetical protein